MTRVGNKKRLSSRLLQAELRKKGEQKENPDWRGHTKVMRRRGGTFLSSAPGVLKSAKFGIVRKLCQAGVGECL